MCLTLCVTTFADSNRWTVRCDLELKGERYVVEEVFLFADVSDGGVWRGGQLLLCVGHLNTFDKWYLIVFVPLGLWQWIEAFVRWRRERRTPPEDGVKPKDDDGPTARTP